MNPPDLRNGLQLIAHVTFVDDEDCIDFVRSAYYSERGVHRVVDELARQVETDLVARGWTRHGMHEEHGDAQEWVAPGKFYVRHEEGSRGRDADDPRVICGTWRCSCGYEATRLFNAEGHRLGPRHRSRESIDISKGWSAEHAVTEIERVGPRHDTYAFDATPDWKP